MSSEPHRCLRGKHPKNFQKFSKIFFSIGLFNIYQGRRIWRQNSNSFISSWDVHYFVKGGINKIFQNIQNGGHFFFYVHVIMAHLSTPPPKQTLSNRPTYLGVIKICLLCSPLNARVNKLKEQTESLPSNHLRSGRLISGYLIMYIHFNPCNLSLLIK